ncbi:hypothetical protein D3C84_1223260 [compost metagenome]
MLAQVFDSYRARALMVDVDLGVELAHGFIIQLLGQRLEQARQLRVSVEDFLAHHGGCGVVGEVVFVVFQQL